MLSPKVHFETFMSQLIPTNATLNYYTDFVKCYNNVNDIEIKLNTLNYLIGKEDLKSAVSLLWKQSPQVFSVLGILIAVRESKKHVVISQEGNIITLEKFFKTEERVVEYLEDTGLHDLFRNKKIKNLVDYVFGIEVGLDTNARKNRSGRLMEGRIREVLKRAGVPFREQVSYNDFPEVKRVLGSDRKQFDFVLTTSHTIYLMEVNFYNGGGSKLNEVARSYTEIAKKINGCNGYEFVWVTDGCGWHSAKTKLEEAYKSIPRVYNLTTFNDFVSSLKD